jgi:GAF domain-containing protein
VVVNDVQADPNFLPNPLLPKTRAEMAVPMLVSGKVIGVLDVQSEQVNRFTDTDVNIQTTLASQIAVALQNARSFTNAQKQAERETKLNLIAQKIQSTATIEEAMQIAARELGHALGKRQTLVALEPSALAGDNKGVAIK